MSKTTLATRPANGGQPIADPITLGRVFAESGMFKDATDPAKAIVKIIAGQEMGIGPMAAMTGIDMIEGKPTLSANLLASQVKRHPNYDYKVVDHLDDVCTIIFSEDGEPIGESKFTLADAEKAGVAGKQNYRRYPKAMMFARALSQGVRWYCPDVTAGTTAYVPEELGAVVDADGAVVELPPEEEAERPDLSHGRDIPSAGQLDYLKGLLMLQGVEESTANLVAVWGAQHLTGGSEGTCSRAITALKNEQAENQDEAVAWLTHSAEKWDEARIADANDGADPDLARMAQDHEAEQPEPPIDPAPEQDEVPS